MSEQYNVVECRHLSKTYQDGKVYTEVLKDFDLTVARGERLALVGASGCGKSTLLHLLGGLDKPSHGQVSILGQKVNQLSTKQQGLLRNRYLGFVYQFHHLLPEFSALENTAMPLLIRGSPIRYAKEQASAILTQVGLRNRIKHRLGELSGGERQRVAIARALVTRPACLLADEPTGNIDHRTAETLYELLLDLHRQYQLSLIVATHDRHLASMMDRVVDMEAMELERGDEPDSTNPT